MKFKVPLVLLVLLVLFGAFLRFYKLDFGQGLFTHPDEYHIVSSINQLSFPSQMNPHFFSYGTVIIYLIYFTKLLLFTMNHELITVNLFLIGRFYSALFSTLTIPLVYLISDKILPRNYALLAAASVALTAGLIQQAHFATPEGIFIFFLLVSLFCLLNFVQNKKVLWLTLSSVSLGLTLGVKVSSAVFLPVLLFGIFLGNWPSLVKSVKFIILSLILTATTFFIGAPFVFLDFPAFWQSFQYEAGLAAGKFLVFYTRQFIDTTPVLFQMEKIFPYALGPALLVFGLAGLFLMTYFIFRSTQHRFLYLLLVTCYLVIFLPNAFLFAKWTRFSSPVFPFFAIFATFFLFKLSQAKIHKLFPLILNSTFIIINLFWALAFFSIYLKDDVRITASKWLEANISPTSVFLVEGGNTVDLPLTRPDQRISLNFYHLEESLERQKVIQALAQADYFLIQSRRVFKNHMRLPDQFPKTANFYGQLFSGQLGFTEIKQFTLYPQISFLNWKIEFPDEDAEETWSVFDHPVIKVFQKL